MPTIECTGITTVVNDDVNAQIVYDDREKMKEIPLHLAERYTEGTNTIPLLLQHLDKYVVGQVNKFYIDETEIDGEKRQVLVASFTIDDESFIEVIQTACYDRQETYPFKFTSSDGFLEMKRDESNEPEEVDLTANLALMQRLPGLSLNHDGKTFDVLELSMCLAGARPCTLLRSAVYKCKAKGKKASKKRTDLFTRFFSSQHAVSNRDLYHKVEKDIKSLNMPKTCLVYSKHSDKNRKEVSENSSTTGKESQTQQQQITLDTHKMEVPPQHSVTSDMDQQKKAMEALANSLAKSMMQQMASPQQPQSTAVPPQPAMPVQNNSNNHSPLQHALQQLAWGNYPNAPMHCSGFQSDYYPSCSQTYGQTLKETTHWA